MKYILTLLCMGMLMAFNLSADRINDVRELDTNGNGIYEAGEVDPCATYQSGPCVTYCPVTRFHEQKYCEKKCITEPYTVQKKCCRYVDQPYQKKCCRYVDQAYEVKCTRMVPEYYTKTECRYIKVPQYFEKQCCRQVPECYTKTCYRKVPEYYNETCYRKVPEYYNECETKYCKKWIQEEKCCYQPYTCIEKRCSDSCPCPQNGDQPRVARNDGRLANEDISDSSFAQTDTAGLRSALLIQIKNANLLNSNESVDIQIDGGNAILSGFVSSKEKRAQIERIVSDQAGVQSVQNNINVR